MRDRDTETETTRRSASAGRMERCRTRRGDSPAPACAAYSFSASACAATDGVPRGAARASEPAVCGVAGGWLCGGGVEGGGRLGRMGIESMVRSTCAWWPWWKAVFVGMAAGESDGASGSSSSDAGSFSLLATTKTWSSVWSWVAEGGLVSTNGSGADVSSPARRRPSVIAECCTARWGGTIGAGNRRPMSRPGGPRADRGAQGAAAGCT
eukprot:scaffold10943_cov102-Isochrysis_galbana.AAC.1